MEFENNTFTVDELYERLGFSTYPSDRELEAKIIMYLRKYNGHNDHLFRFFTAVYDFFFIDSSTEDIVIQEGLEDQNPNPNPNPNPNQNRNQNSDTTAPLSSSSSTNINSIVPLNVNTVSYTSDYINPLLKQTIQRIIIIDSSYRNFNATNVITNPLSTQFTIELSEPLRDVLSLKLYSYSIPYTWYTVNKDFGSNFIILRGTTPGTEAYIFKVEILPGNYNASSLVTAINNSYTNLKKLYPEIDFTGNFLSYNDINTLATFTIQFYNWYREYSFQLDWINWKSPSDEIDRKILSTNIPNYLGFDSKKFDISCVYSTRNYFEDSLLNDSNIRFEVNSSNRSFEIIFYDNGIDEVTGSPKEFITNGNEMNARVIYLKMITLSLPTGQSYTRQEILDNLNFVLKNNEILQSNVVGVTREREVSGKVFYKMNLSWKRQTLPIHPNAKTVVKFPVSTTTNSHIWTGNNSCFQFFYL